MKTFGQCFRCVSAFVFLSAIFPAACAADTNPPPRLTVELRDGSQVIGTGVEHYFKFHSALQGEIKLDVKDIRSVDCVTTNSARLTTANGDTLTVSFADSALAVQTGFGKLELPVDSIRKFTVSVTEGSHSPPATARAADTNSSPRLTVELRDGSQVIGTGVENYFKFHSALQGEIKLAVKDIRSVECISSNSAKLTTTGGDSLTVSFVDSAFAVKTSFGKVDLQVDSVRKFSVAAGGAPGMPADLVADYPLKGDANDATGNGNDGVVQNAIPTTDRLGQANSAYAFADAPGCKITINSTNLLLQPPFSCSVWVNFKGGNRDPRIISVAHAYDGFEIATKGTAAMRQICFNNATTTGDILDCSSKDFFPESAWHHVVAVRSADAMALYVDGQLENTIPAAGPIPYKPGFGSVWLPTIGASGYIGLPYCYFAGSIGGVQFYNRALSAAEVQAMAAE